MNLTLFLRVRTGLAKPPCTQHLVPGAPFSEAVVGPSSVPAVNRVTFPRILSCRRRFAVVALALLPFTCLKAALFMDPGRGTSTNATPALVAGYPGARQAVGQWPPGIYEAGHLHDRLVFVRVAEDLGTSLWTWRSRVGRVELIMSETGSLDILCIQPISGPGWVHTFGPSAVPRLLRFQP